MPKLPVVSGEVVIKALSKRGFIFRKGKGDHVIIQSKDGPLLGGTEINTSLTLSLRLIFVFPNVSLLTG